MAGPAFERARLLRAPGVPRLEGIAILPVASTQLPFTRINTSGQPFSHLAWKRRVAVWPGGLAGSNTSARMPWTQFAPVHIESLARRCRDCALEYPAVVSRLERMWSP